LSLGLLFNKPVKNGANNIYYPSKAISLNKGQLNISRKMILKKITKV